MTIANGSAVVPLGNLAAGAHALNFAQGPVQNGTLIGDVTLTVTGWPAGFSEMLVALLQDNPGNRKLTVEGVVFGSGGEPSWETAVGALIAFTLFTFDGGATVYCASGPAGKTGPTGSVGEPGPAGSAGAVVPDVFIQTGLKNYYEPNISVNTSAILVNQRLRLAPVFLTACTIEALFVEFTVAGEANSLVRPGIYADNGSNYPGELKVEGASVSTGNGNAGTIATGGTPAVVVSTLGSSVALPQGLYWMGGVVQGAPTTQPTMVTGQWSNKVAAGRPALPTTKQTFLTWDQLSVSGTLPANFSASKEPGGATPMRVGFRVA